jgi:hypothetical protein
MGHLYKNQKCLSISYCNFRIGEVYRLNKSFTYKVTGIVILLVGALFFLRDLGINYIGNTSGWTIIIVLVGAGVMAGDFKFNHKLLESGKRKKK